MDKQDVCAECETVRLDGNELNGHARHQITEPFEERVYLVALRELLRARLKIAGPLVPIELAKAAKGIADASADVCYPVESPNPDNAKQATVSE